VDRSVIGKEFTSFFTQTRGINYPTRPQEKKLDIITPDKPNSQFPTHP
jgi:hypothetical protein